MLNIKYLKRSGFSLPTKILINDGFDKSGFLVAFFIGFLGISCLKIFHFHQIWVSLFPILIMFFYAGMLFLSFRARLGEDQSGDNLYYLGFLFTLISLAFALYQFSDEGGNAVIIENFGIALSSTICGLFLRILFNQMRHDPVEIEREARLELASAASRLRTELLETTQTMKGVLLAVKQQTSEVIQSNFEQFEVFAKTIINQSTDSHNAILENTKKIEQTTKGLIDGIEQLISRINNLSPSQNLLENKLSDAINPIRQASEEIVNRIKNDNQSIKQSTKIIKSAIDASEILENKINLLSDQSEKINSIFSNLDRIAISFKESGESFHNASKKVSQLCDAQVQTQTYLDNVLSKLSDTANNTLERTSQYQKNILENLEKTFSETVKNTNRYNNNLANELNRSSEYTQKIHSSLVSMTDSLAEQLSNSNEIKINPQMSPKTNFKSEEV